MKIALSLVLCFSLSVYATNKCLMNAEALELSKIYKTSTSASKSAEFVHLATALHHLSVTDDSTGEALNCSQHLWRALGQSLIREDQTIDKLKKSISSWHDVSQVRQILSKCQNADVAHRRFQNAFVTTNHYRLTWLELQNACVTYNPDMALVTLINRMGGDEMSGRLELARNALFSSRYDHAKYKQFADYMMGEATRCAVLAITCLSIRYANATTPELAVFSMDNKQRLQEINESLEQGFESLREEFFEQQLDEDLREQQNLGFDSNLDIFEETDAMFNFLSNKYPFRGWAAIRFDSNDQWPADHAIWGSNDRYKKLLNYGEHSGYRSNLIVHGAKQYERNCSNFKNFVNSKPLIHHLTAEQRERLQANEENLQFSVNILKEWLINIAQAPNRLFALVVRFTPLYDVEYNPDYHYKELIRDNNNRTVKIVVVGWC